MKMTLCIDENTKLKRKEKEKRKRRANSSVLVGPRYSVSTFPNRVIIANMSTTPLSVQICVGINAKNIIEML